MRASIVFAAILSSMAAVVSGADKALLIPAERIYTAPDAAPLANGALLVRGGRIVGVADEHSRLAIPKGTRTSDCRGVAVAGFQNSHVHFMEPVWNDAAHANAESLSKALDAMLTKYGYTTVFDTGSDQANTIALRARIEKREVRGPRILTVGLPLYPVDGIPIYIKDLPADVLGRMHQPKDAAEARDNVRTNLANGADGTKLFLHTSPDGQSARFMSMDVIRAAVEETHAQGKLVLAHPTSLEAIRGAIAGGVDILVHTTLGEKDPWDAAVIEQLKQKNMSVIPTFKLWVYELRKQNVPAPVIDKLVAATLEELRAFHSAGGQVLFGTDVGYMHDYDPTDEYVFMQQAGMTPTQILASLTTAPAARWNEGDRRGRLVPGADADIVVLAADPVEDVRSFAKVRCVFRGGRQVYPSPDAR
jgi:imidazolonepropionase-like amidohydrolase